MRPGVRLALVAFVAALGCARQESPPADGAADAQGHTAPTPVTAAANAAVAKALPLADPQDFEDARRGLIAGDGDVVIPGRAADSPSGTRDATPSSRATRRRA